MVLGGFTVATSSLVMVVLLGALPPTELNVPRAPHPPSSDPSAADPSTAESAHPPVEAKPATCAECHAQSTDEHIAFLDGSRRSVFVAPEIVEDSVHGREVGCVDCHRDQRMHPHEPVRFLNERDFSVNMSKVCHRCHHAYSTRLEEGVHRRQLDEGDHDAPTCVDCHGAHDTEKPGSPRTAISERCGRCHDDVAKTYASSVHGAALAEGDPDVPTCTDCHGAHRIQDPEDSVFHAGSHLFCARCHADARKMRRHGLNPNVLTTFLDDFHGSSNRLYREIGHIPERPVATCGDCHGVHDAKSIYGTRDRGEGDGSAMLGRGDEGVGGGPDSEAMLATREAKTRVSAMCRKCHEGAPEDFGDAWLGHRAAKLSTNPMVWVVTWSYRILIPVILLGLVLHILLHLWHFGTRAPKKGHT